MKDLQLKKTSYGLRNIAAILYKCMLQFLGVSVMENGGKCLPRDDKDAQYGRNCAGDWMNLQRKQQATLLWARFLNPQCSKSLEDQS